MSTVTNGYVDTRDGQIHYRRAGHHNDAPIVMLHMVGSSSRAFESLMVALAPDIPSIALDMMNYGESFRTRHDPSVGYIARIFVDALAALDVKRFYILGHHFGAAVAIEIARLAPNKVLGVILNGIAYATPDETAPFEPVLAVSNPISAKGVQLIWAWSRIKDNADLPNAGVTPGMAEIMHRDVVDMLRAGEDWHWGYQAAFGYDPTLAMRDLTCPVMFVSGERDPVNPFHQRAVRAFPDATAYLHPDGGMYLAETHTGDLAEQLRTFTRRADQVRVIVENAGGG